MVGAVMIHEYGSASSQNIGFFIGSLYASSSRAAATLRENPCAVTAILFATTFVHSRQGRAAA